MFWRHFLDKNVVTSRCVVGLTIVCHSVFSLVEACLSQLLLYIIHSDYNIDITIFSSEYCDCRMSDINRVSLILYRKVVKSKNPKAKVWTF